MVRLQGPRSFHEAPHGYRRERDVRSPIPYENSLHVMEPSKEHTHRVVENHLCQADQAAFHEQVYDSQGLAADS